MKDLADSDQVQNALQVAEGIYVGVFGDMRRRSPAKSIQQSASGSDCDYPNDCDCECAPQCPDCDCN